MTVKAVDPRTHGPHAQTQRAKWRGLVRLTRVRRRLPRPFYEARSLDGWIDSVLAHDPTLEAAMNGRHVAYFKATLLGDGTLNVREEVGRKRYYQRRAEDSEHS